MVRDIRITYRRRCSYRTKSNKLQPVKTPGNRLVAHVLKKSVNGPKCGECGRRLGGLKATTPSQRTKLTKNQRTVSRAYGGNLCATCCKQKIMRAFLVEEQKVANKVILERMRKQKQKERAGN